jgi:hypothetical protein
LWRTKVGMRHRIQLGHVPQNSQILWRTYNQVRRRIWTLSKQTGLMLCSVRNTALAQWLRPLLALGSPGSNLAAHTFFPYFKNVFLTFSRKNTTFDN